MMTDADVASAVLRQLNRGAYAIGSHDSETVATAPADWVMQVSVAPCLVAVAIGNQAETLRNLQESGVLTVNLLPEEHGTGDSQRFGLGEHTGCPILEAATGWLECRVRMTVPVGDHTLVIGRVIAGGVNSS